MGFGGSPPTPPPVQLPPPAAHPATLGSAMSEIVRQKSEQTARAAAGKGSGGTVQTGQQGLKMEPPTAKATLLGQ